jgi:hypothetical protein
VLVIDIIVITKLIVELSTIVLHVTPVAEPATVRHATEHATEFADQFAANQYAVHHEHAAIHAPTVAVDAVGVAAGGK